MSKHKIFVSFLCKWRAPLDLTLHLLSMQKCLHTWPYSSRISIVLSLVLSVSFEPVKTILPGIIIIIIIVIIIIIIIILNCYCNYNSETLLYGYIIIMDSLLCPWKKKSLTFLSKFNSLNTDILSIQTLSMATSVSFLIGFDLIIISIIIIIV